MKRSLRSLNILVLASLLCLTFCSKEESAPVSLAKIPVTTTSTLAADEYQKGIALANKVQPIQAATHYRLALDEDPTFASAWLNLAMVSPGTHLFVSALDSAKAYASGASEGEQLIIQATQYGFEGKNTEQEKTLQELVSKYPGDENAHLLLGNYYFGLQQYHEAILSFNQATQINGELAILYNQLGYSQRALGNYGEAEKAFKYYIRLNADNPNAFDSYAELLMEMGRFTESIEFYAKALELDPNFVASHIGIACDYAFLGEPERARTQLELLKEIAQNHIDTRRAIFTEALTYVCEGDLPLAVETILTNFKLAEARQDVGNMANDLVLLGNLFLEMSKPEKALQQFKQSMVVADQSSLPQPVKDNAHTFNLYNIARVFAMQHNFPKAKEMAALFAQQVDARKNPIQIKLIAQLNGIIALEEGNYQAAIDELEDANQLNPYNLFRIGAACAALGDNEQAATYKLRAAELNVLNSMDQAIVLSKTKFFKSPS